MNGTLCFRSEVPVRGAKEDLYVRRKYYYTRKGIEAFVDALVRSQHFEVVVYSSMMEHNIRAGLNCILPRQDLRVLDRAMNKVDPAGENEWDTVRDMEKVWRALPQYGPTNTLLLDNEFRKFQDTPNNGIVVPEFGAAEVKARTSGTLDALLDYLLRRAGVLPVVATKAPADVRKYLSTRPFGAKQPLHAPAAPAPPAPAAPAPAAPATAAPATAAPPPHLVEEDDLTALLGGMQLGGRGEGGEAGSKLAATAATAAATAAGEGGEVGGGAPAAGAEGEARVVPMGTALRLACIEDGTFQLVGTYNRAGGSRAAVKHVCGPAGHLRLRVDARMDFHRLVNESASAGCELEISHEVLS